MNQDQFPDFSVSDKNIKKCILNQYAAYDMHIYCIKNVASCCLQDNFFLEMMIFSPPKPILAQIGPKTFLPLTDGFLKNFGA